MLQNTVVGAALLQEHPDGVFPVKYASKKLLPRECRYSVIERECLAIVIAMKKFEKYLYGKEFTLQTDHKPLAYIQKAKRENSHITRWALFCKDISFVLRLSRDHRTWGLTILIGWSRGF